MSQIAGELGFRRERGGVLESPVPSPAILAPSEVAEWRLAHNLTQKAMAQMIGVSLFTLCRWEGGAVRPMPMLALALEALDTKLPKGG